MSRSLKRPLEAKKAAKDYILELYLNTISLNHGLNGVGAAAEYYFGKEVSDLSLAECACIAGITKNPSRYSPISNPEANKERQTLVLDKMLELGYIDQSQYDTAMAEDIYSHLVGKASSDEDSEALHNYFVDHLIVTLAEDLQTERGLTKQEAYNLIYSGGLQIYSTIGQDIQTRLEQVFADDSLFPPSDTTYDATYTISVLNTETNEQEHHSESRNVSSREEAEAFAEEMKAMYVDDTHKLVLDNLAISNSLQAAMVILDYQTGNIKAIVGGRGAKERRSCIQQGYSGVPPARFLLQSARGLRSGNRSGYLFSRNVCQGRTVHGRKLGSRKLVGIKLQRIRHRQGRNKRLYEHTRGQSNRGRRSI